MKLICIALLLVATTGLSVSAQGPHPNIIVMMADDMGMGDTSALSGLHGQQ